MPGVYARDGELHLDFDEICEAGGVECNEHNAQILMHAAREAFRRILMHAAREAFRRLEAGAPVEFVEEL